MNPLKNSFLIKVSAFLLLFPLVSCINAQTDNTKSIIGYYYYWYVDESHERPVYNEVQFDSSKFYNVSAFHGYHYPRAYTLEKDQYSILPDDPQDTVSLSFQIIENSNSRLKFVALDKSEIVTYYKMDTVPSIDIKNANKKGNDQLAGDQFMERMALHYKRHFIDSKNAELSGSPALVNDPKYKIPKE